MAEVTMPKMGFDMQEGTIVRWLKKVGDEVKKGEPIAEIETDKVTIEIESFSSGTLTQIVADEGAVVAVGAPIAILDGGDGAAAPAPSDGGAAASSTAGDTPQAGAAPEQFTGEGGEGSTAVAQQTEAAAQDSGSAAATSAEPANGRADGGHVPASPVAKRLARENNVDIAQVSGSGPGGRIVRKDVEAFVQGGGAKTAPQPAAQPAAEPQPAAQPAQQPAAQPQPAAQQPQAEQRPGTRREPMSRLRQTIARRMAQSKGPVPHFYVTTEIDMGAAMALRKQLNASGGDVKITVNDMIVKASAIAIGKYPALNASFAEDSLDYHDYVNVSIAVATDNGLLAPAVTDVDKKSLGTISAEAKDLIERTRNGKATPDELGRGTFSVSNLGMYPVDSFVAIINPPQAMILAVGAVNEQPVVRNGEITIGQIMKVTISIDHRVSDGAVGAQYLAELKRLLENPMLILL